MLNGCFVQHDPSRTYFPLVEVEGDLTQKLTGAEFARLNSPQHPMPKPVPNKR